MQVFVTSMKNGLLWLLLMGGFAALMMIIQYFNFRKMKNQFSDCILRKGVVQEMGVRAPTKNRPYQHCYVICSFSNGRDLVEIPYESGDLNHVRTGDEIPIYFYPNGAATVVAYNDETIKKKFRQHVIVILILFAVLSFFIPAVGSAILNRM